MSSSSDVPRENEAVHRLKNHLTIILGFCDLLLEDLAEDDAHRRDVVEIRNAAREALEQIPAIAERMT